MFLVAFAIALILTVLLIPLVKRLAYPLKAIDRPGFRKIHNKPMPLTGGLAIYLAFSVALLLASGLSRQSLMLVALGAVFVIFGALDDRGIVIRARYKIWSHLMFSFLFVYLSGLHFEFFRNAWLNWFLTVGFITFMTNSMNMLDGMDGLVSGISFLSAGFFAILAVNSGQPGIVVICLVLMGATLGFLVFNFNPASIFLGEGGSTFLGFLLAVIAIKLSLFGLWDVALLLGIERLQFISFIVPLIILGIPIFDTYFVFANRFLHHIKFSQPGKDHSHHRINLMGFSQKATVLTLYGIQIVLGAIALSMIRSDLQQFFSLLVIVAVFFIGFSIFLMRADVYA